MTTINTRHYGMISIGAISTAVTILGAIHNNIPAWSTYLETTAIPTVITILDWVVARIKDAKGINSISITDIISILGSIKTAKDAIPPIVKTPEVSTPTPAPTAG